MKPNSLPIQRSRCKINSPAVLPRRAAFTLVEVLIVVAIIGILAAILLPVFNRARQTARGAVCQSNLRQIGLALDLYVNDHNRFYPDRLLSLAYCSWADDVLSYTKTNKVFTCPLAPIQSASPACALGGPMDYLLNVPDGMVQLHQGRIKSPSQLILVLDGNQIGGFTEAGSGTGPLSSERLKDMGVDLRHNDGSNALFADGHTKWLSEGKLTDRSLWSLSGQS